MSSCGITNHNWPLILSLYVTFNQAKELFLDYGDNFEQAWQRHAAEYKPATPNAEKYMDGFTIDERQVPQRPDPDGA
jgi:hypothetical protein